MKTAVQATVSSVSGLALMALLLFWPAGTFDYWQAWAFFAIFVGMSAVFTLYLGVKNPEVLRRRLRAGPTAEARTVQKIVVAGVYVTFFGTLVVSALDHRFGWSNVPTAVNVAGDVLVAVGFAITMFVVIQNSYASATITVEAEQKVVSTGLYGLVRHPMYFGGIVVMIGIPLALDSYWGLVVVIPGLIAIFFRILDEEKMLEHELVGYDEYAQKVRYRLLPYVW
jgi:protein-S-isoprenylcysteine O-methyltransferase Ste14